MKLLHVRDKLRRINMRVDFRVLFADDSIYLVMSGLYGSKNMDTKVSFHPFLVHLGEIASPGKSMLSCAGQQVCSWS